MRGRLVAFYRAYAQPGTVGVAEYLPRSGCGAGILIYDRTSVMRGSRIMADRFIAFELAYPHTEGGLSVFLPPGCLLCLSAPRK